jgi:hypothetical protein
MFIETTRQCLWGVSQNGNKPERKHALPKRQHDRYQNGKKSFIYLTKYIKYVNRP